MKYTYICEHLKTLPVFTRVYVLEWTLKSKCCHKCSWKQITLKSHVIGNAVSTVCSFYSGVLRQRRETVGE